MISLESEIMSNSYDPPGLLDGLGSGCRADAGPATSPSSIEGRGTASKDGGVKPPVVSRTSISPYGLA